MKYVKQITINVVTFEGLSKQAKSYAKDNITDVLNDVLESHIQEIKTSKDSYITAYEKGNLYKLNKDECPLTGVCYDYDFLEIDYQNCDSVINEANKIFMKLKRDARKDVFSDEHVTDFCEANEIYFLENGEEFHSLERLMKGI